ncbi:hypothetical protein CFC21_080986 [Triticum aestivum]|uniref:NAC domain-containing protein n=2 Tax=Triticum aestivum TaxID=4565 RepID=A0A3B6N2J0_WHEAT|nr:uncharacterized protein LOC123123809 isoform X2 [Triticum aestivum]KAF7076316.1 hypothetical protein CFC21_080986 [Triticum aestivum]
MSTGHGREGSCYFYSKPAPVKEGKRTRMVGGGTWHPEAGAKPILGADGESLVSNKRTFSYVKKSPSGMETASKGRQRTGWIMVEISLEKQTGDADHMVLCVLYKSKKKYPDTSMAAAAEAAPGCDAEPSVHEWLGLSDRDIRAVPKPAPSIDTAGSTKILLQKAAEKAVSYHFEKVCEIKEFVDFKERHLRTIDQLGLDRPIISGSLRKLELRLQHVAMDKILTPTERDHIVSCGEDMSTTIFSAYLNKLGKRAQQDFSALYRIGLNVHDHVWERETKAANDSSVVHDSEAKHRLQVLHAAFLEVGFLSQVKGAESECPMPVNSASSSGEKRKADEVHPEAPSAVRQEKPDTGRNSVVEERERTALFDDKAGDPREFFDTIQEDTIEPVRTVTEVQPEQPPGVEDEYPVPPTGVDNPYGNQVGDFNAVVPEVQPGHPEVGEGSNGLPNFLDLDETESSRHTIKEPNHGALKRLENWMDSDSNDYPTRSDDSAMQNPVFVEYQTLVGRPNGGDSVVSGHPMFVGGNNGGYPPAAENPGPGFVGGVVGDNSVYSVGSAAKILEEACPMFDEDGHRYLDDINMEEPLIDIDFPLSPFAS